MQDGQANTKSTISQRQAIEYMDLRELISLLWQKRYLLIAIMTVFAVGSVAYSLMLPDIYRADALMAAKNTENNRFGGISSELGGLAGLAGVELPGGGADRTDLALAVLESRTFLIDFVNRHDLYPDLFAVKEWDKRSRQLTYDFEVYNSKTDKWLVTKDNTDGVKPTAQEAYRALSEHLDVVKDSDTGFVTIAVEHVSPVVARNWVSWLISDLNDTLKRQDVERAERAVAYLRDRAEATSLQDLRKLFFDMLRSQIETIMLANVSSEYLFQTVDGPLEPEYKTSPKRAIICILGTVLGAICGVIVVLLRFNTYRNKK